MIFKKKEAPQEVYNKLAELSRRVLALETEVEEVQTKVLSSLKRYNQRLAALNNKAKQEVQTTTEDSIDFNDLYQQALIHTSSTPINGR